MARQDINLGTAPTGAGGDTTRSTGFKINAMTAELYAALGAPSSGAIPAALPVNRGGTGGSTQAAAQVALGLGTAATLNTGRSAGNVPTMEMIGIASTESTVPWTAENYAGIDNKVFSSAASGLNPQGGTGLYYRQTIQFGTTGNRLMIAWPYGLTGNTGTIKMRSVYNGAVTPEIELYHTGNTTRASDGTLKAI
ncbi:hypothetical protein VRC24_16855 [Pseudomonas poae]|uniref:hypothetical protein n=1 Tax=Pseudomonas poae TaxID=200451 RepID=UPI0030D3A83D